MGGSKRQTTKPADGELAQLQQTLRATQCRIAELCGAEQDEELDLVHSLNSPAPRTDTHLARKTAPLSEVGQLTAVLNALPAHIALLDSDGTITDVNDAWRAFASANALTDTNFCIGQNYIHACRQSSNSVNVGVELDRLLRGERSNYSLEYPCHAPDERRWFRMMVSPFVHGNRRGAVVMHIDITDRILAEEELQERQQLLSKAQRTGKMGSWSLDLRTNILHWSDETCRLFGIKPGTFDGRVESFYSFVVAEDHAKIALAHERSKKHGGRIEVEYRIRLADGSVRWIYEQSEFEFDETNTAIRRLGMVIDTTERKMAEAALATAQRHVSLILNSTAEGTHGIDTAGNILFENPAAIEMLGWNESEMIGRPAHQLIHHHYSDGSLYPDHACPILHTILDGKTRRVDTEVFFRKDGSSFPVEYAASPVRDETGAITGVVVNFRDITQRKRTEERLALLNFARDRTKEAIYLVDETARFLDVNETSIRDLGYTRLELLSMNVMDVVVDMSESRWDSFWQELKAHNSITIESFHRRKDGTTFPVEVDINSFDYEGGAYALALARDITERRRHEHMRDEETKVLELISLGSPLDEVLQAITQTIDKICPEALASILLLDEDGIHLRHGAAHKLAPEYVSAIDGLSIGPDAGSCGSAAYRRERVFVSDILTDPRWEPYRDLATASGLRACWSSPVIDSNGTVVATLALYQRVPGMPDKHHLELMTRAGNLVNIAVERDRDEKALRASEERFRLLSRATNDAIWDWDIGANSIWWNEGVESLFGYKREDIEQSVEARFEYIHPEDRDWVRAELQAAIRGEAENWTGEYRFLCSNQRYAYIRDRGQIIRNNEGTAIRMIGGMTDLSERKEAELRLTEQAALLDQASDAIIVRDLDNRILFWNRGAERIYGWHAEEVLGKSVAEVLHHKNLELLREATDIVIKKGEWTGELTHTTRNGSTVTILGRWTLLRNEKGLPKSILAINTNITDRKLLEEQILRAQRMESIGTLAGGIAHDLNNILAPILMSLELLPDYIADPDALEMLTTMRGSAQRGADLIKQVLGFARGMEGERRAISLVALVKDIRKFTQDTFPRNIEIAFHMPNDVWPIHADPTHIHQVLMNLCVNARDAMPEGGKVSVSLENIIVDEVFSGMNVQSKPGPYVVLRVEDTGIGIPKEVQARMFEPFFTTKEMGKGTGLGLSTTFSIVRDHGGFINVYSEPGVGTKFNVYLPATPMGIILETADPATNQLPKGSGQLILLVDDEANIRDVTKRALERFGYHVLLAQHGAEAVTQYKEHMDSIDVVLTDMSMPVMDGPALIAALRELNPDVRIIGSSGFAANSGMAKSHGFSIEHFVPKPYTAETLMMTLNTVLSTKRATPPAMTEKQQAVNQRSKNGGKATVLVVDDEQSICSLARRALESAGHTVKTASNAASALEYLEASDSNPVQIILTDLRMPEMSGAEFVESVRRLYPGILLIVMSGDTAMNPNDVKAYEVCARVISKPFTVSELREVVQSVLEIAPR